MADCIDAVRSLRDKEKEFDLLQAQNRQIRETYVKIYAKAEQEEEYISNILLKRIQKLKNDKETLAQKYEQEEEYLTNELMRRIQQLQSERDSLEGKMKTEQAALIDNLLMTIKRMETEVSASRKNMEKMRKEKIDQENALETEQELLFNTLGKQMDQHIQEKKKMQAELEKAYESGFLLHEEYINAMPPPSVSPFDLIERPSSTQPSGDVSPSMKLNRLRGEVSRLRNTVRTKDSTIAELQARLDTRERAFRDLMETHHNHKKFIKSFVEGGRELCSELPTTFPHIEGGIAGASSERSDMGPPSVQSSTYAPETDMDDASSRGSFHSDMN